MKFEMKSKNARATETRRYAFEVSLPGLVGMGSALLLGLIWVFIFGVLVGRGYDADASPAQEEAPLARSAEVIQPEDLNFFEQLQDTSPAEGLEAAPPAAPIREQDEASAPAPAIREVATAPAEAQAPPDPQGVASDDQQVYDYLYQVASFRNEQSAATLKDRIRQLGLTAEVETSDSGGQIWYRVNVRFQGRPEDTRSMKEKLGTLGLERPLLRSKVPV